MSILIKGMEMPKTPLLVCIYPNGICSDEEGKIYRAVPVSPHGRCIDADALTISTAVPLDGKPYRYVHIDNIENAPTIIPAEEGE